MAFRIEEKVLVNKYKIIDLIKWLEIENGYKKYPQRLISSIYFDTDNLDMFNNSVEGNVPRKKIRIRAYNQDCLSSNNINLEKKITSPEGRYKESQKIDLKNLKNYIKKGIYDFQYGICKPKLKVNYFRNYYSVKNVMVTLDKKITYFRVNSFFEKSICVNEPEIAVEIKSSSGHSIEYFYKNFPFQRTRFSKYTRGIEAIKSYNLSNKNA